MVDFAIEPARTALLVTDTQNCFVEGYPISAPDGRAVLERLNRVVDAAHDAGIPVIFTAHVVRPDGSNVGVMGEIIPPVAHGVIDLGWVEKTRIQNRNQGCSHPGCAAEAPLI